jgi:RNase P subunit RPR2
VTGDATTRAVTPPQQAAQQQGQHAPRLSVSTTSSKSSGRTSLLSTATSMTSVSSQGGGPATQEIAPPLPPPPAPPVKSSNRGSSKPQGAYWCTFCDVAFQRKFDWKRHEDEFHERYKRYPCPNCNRIFWGANTFNQHHKNAHGCTTCPHADRVVRYTHKKTAWYVFCLHVAEGALLSPVSLHLFSASAFRCFESRVG